VGVGRVFVFVGSSDEYLCLLDMVMLWARPLFVCLAGMLSGLSVLMKSVAVIVAGHSG